MKDVASCFSADALAAMKKQLGIELSDQYDYSDEELCELYERITENFPYSYGESGEPTDMGRIFESIIDVFCKNKLIKFE